MKVSMMNSDLTRRHFMVTSAAGLAAFAAAPVLALSEGEARALIGRAVGDIKGDQLGQDRSVAV